MGRQRWFVVLTAAAVLAGTVVGGALLAARPGGSDDVRHRLTELEMDNATQVGTTVVLEDGRQLISLLDLETGEVHEQVTRAFGRWYAGRGPVVLLTSELGRVVAHGHDGAVLWATPEERSRTARPVAVFEDGTTVLRDCVDERCTHRALAPDGDERWSHPADDGQPWSPAWFSEEVDTDRPILLPGRMVLHTARTADDTGAGEPGGDHREVLLIDPATGQASGLGTGRAVAGADVIALLDTADGACDLTLVPATSEQVIRLPGVCDGAEQPSLWLVGDNAVISGAGESADVLVATADGTVAAAPEGLRNVEATAAGLIGLDESSWLFGTNDAGTMSHRTDADGWLQGTGSEAIVVTRDRQPWNPFARGTVRHLVLDPVTGQRCGELATAETFDVVPLPGCRAVVTDPGAGETLVVGRP